MGTESSTWYKNTTKYKTPELLPTIPRETAVLYHRLRLGYRCNWEIEHKIERECSHCNTNTQEPLIHYLLECEATQTLRDMLDIPNVDPAEPEARAIASGMASSITDDIERFLPTIETSLPPR